MPIAPSRRSITRRAALAGLGAGALGLAAGCATQYDSPVSGFGFGSGAMAGLRLIGEARLPHRLQFQGSTVGGLSGLDYDPAQDLWYALSDDRSDLGPARWYTMRLPLSAQALGAPQLLGMTPLRQPDGSFFPNRREGGQVADPEALRCVPQTGTLLWTSEGDMQRGLDPFVREATADGRHLREFQLPGMLRTGGAPGTGPRENLGFEGLAITPDGSGVWAAMEGPLLQDGPVPGVGKAGGPCRFTLFDRASGRPLRQIAYLPDPIPRAPQPPGGFADNGVSEILLQDAAQMLVLERAYMTGVGNSLRLYRIDTRQGSDTLAQAALAPGGYAPVPKTLLADFDRFVGPSAILGTLQRLDNTEGMAWGPRLPGTAGRPGPRTLVCVSDDNFNPGQVTQFLAFEFLEPTP